MNNSFRKYNDASLKKFYYDQHTKLTYKKAVSLNTLFLEAPKRAYSITELLTICDNIYDSSDPDTSLSQTEHAYQTAQEAMNRFLPIEFVIIGLIHDLGKSVMRLLNIDMTYLVGDTYPLGAPFEYKHITLGESLLQNPDHNNSQYNEDYGIYYPSCGFEKMIFTGHDEFMYMALCESKHLLPEWALYTIRFHSFYPWHDKGAYAKYASHKDRKYLSYLKEFNQCDLYTKHNQPINKEKRKIIDKLVIKYLPNGIMFPDIGHLKS